MKAPLLLTGACIAMIASPALACRWTTEFPVVLKQFEQSTISSLRLDQLRSQLIDGEALHEQGHRLGVDRYAGEGMGQMAEALGILDGIKAEIGQ